MLMATTTPENAVRAQRGNENNMTLWRCWFHVVLRRSVQLGLVVLDRGERLFRTGVDGEGRGLEARRCLGVARDRCERVSVTSKVRPGRVSMTPLTCSLVGCVDIAQYAFRRHRPPP